MSPLSQQIEWQFLEEENEDAPQWQRHIDDDKSKNAQATPVLHRLYELIIVIAVIYGSVVCLVWQQSARRHAALAEELEAVRSELFQYQSDLAERSEHTANGERPALRLMDANDLAQYQHNLSAQGNAIVPNQPEAEAPRVWDNEAWIEENWYMYLEERRELGRE